MDDKTRLLLNEWAEDKSFSLPNALLEEIKEVGKKKRSLIKICLFLLYEKRLPEAMRFYLEPWELCDVNMRIFKKYFNYAQELTQRYLETKDNYTKIKMTTVLRIMAGDTSSSHIFVFLEMCKQNALFRVGNKRKRSDNYSVWCVYTKDFKKKLKNVLSEKQIRNSILYLKELGLIYAEKIEVSKDSKKLRHPYWRLAIIDMAGLSKERVKERKKSYLNNLEGKFKKYFNEQNDPRSDEEILELITFFKETKDWNGNPWINPLKALETDFKHEDRFLMQTFYTWKEDRRLQACEAQKEAEKEVEAMIVEAESEIQKNGN